jgi:amphiphysin
VQRTANENEWWIGKIGARQGQFPGKCIDMMKRMTARY